MLIFHDEIHLYFAIYLCNTCFVCQNGVTQTLPKVLLPHGAHKTIAGKDTVIESDTTKENKEPQYFYISALTAIYVNTHGGLAKRFAPALEVGRTYGIFDFGLATGG